MPLSQLYAGVPGQFLREKVIVLDNPQRATTKEAAEVIDQALAQSEDPNSSLHGLLNQLPTPFPQYPTQPQKVKK